MPMQQIRTHHNQAVTVADLRQFISGVSAMRIPWDNTVHLEDDNTTIVLTIAGSKHE